MSLVAERVALRCHRCGRAVGMADTAMLPVGVFDAQWARKLVEQIPRTHSEERRVRCRHCCWINIFHPVRESAEVVLK